MSKKLPIVTFLLLASCTQYEYVKDGASNSVRENDTLDCRLEVAQVVPASQQLYTNPSTGQQFSIDTNDNLRAQAFRRCMTEKGYARMEK